MTLKTRPPTGRVPWPLILVEGGEKAGKSWAAAVLTGSSRVGRCRWLDLGEGAGDEYGAVPGASYEMIEHDGTWQSIIAAVEDARDEARDDAEAGQPPYVLIIDSMTLIWDMLKDWASNRAKKTDSNKAKLRADPNAEIVVAPNFWNDANARHRRLMTVLMTFPGVVIVTARGKEVAELDSKGTPIAGRKGYRVEGHKDLAFDATVWLRLARDEEPLIVGCRSVHAGIQPGADKARRVPGLELDRLIFDVLRCKPTEARVRDLVPLVAGDAGPDGETAADQDGPARMTPAARTELTRLLREADMMDRDAALRYINGIIAPAQVDGTPELTAEQGDQVLARLRSYVAQQTPPDAPPPAEAKPAPAAKGMVTPAQHRTMHAIWNELGFGGDARRDERLAVTSRILGREVTSSSTLTEDEAEGLIEALDSKRRELKAAAAKTPAAATPEPSSAEPATAEQRKAIIAGLADRGITKPSAMLAFVNEAIAPASVTNARELTEFTAAQVLGALAGGRKP